MKWFPHDPRAAGFTAIELTAILAVTAIILALSVSAYRTYTVRAEIAIGVASTVGARDRVGRAFRATGQPPADSEAAGVNLEPVDSWGDYVAGVKVTDGRVDIRFGRSASEALAGQVLSLTPFETTDLEIVWICGNKVPGVGLLPLGFAGGTRQAVQVLTTIDARYLPPNCR